MKFVAVYVSFHQGYRFHKLLRTFTTFYYCYKDFVFLNTIFPVRDLIRKRISQQCCNDDVINKAEMYNQSNKVLDKFYSYTL